MDAKEMGELLSRIDERTENISKRQEEEIHERKGLDSRIGSLENWRSYLGGSVAVAYLILSAIGYAVKSSLSHKN